MRRMFHQQIEATADFRYRRTRSGLDLEPSILQRWEDGVRVDQLERINGWGTPVSISWTKTQRWPSTEPLRFPPVGEDGETVADRLHVDGVLTGDAGEPLASFATSRQRWTENASGVFHRVPHHRENGSTSWIERRLLFGNRRLGAHHNESWSMTWWTSSMTTAPSAVGSNPARPSKVTRSQSVLRFLGSQWLPNPLKARKRHRRPGSWPDADSRPRRPVLAEQIGWNS